MLTSKLIEKLLKEVSDPDNEILVSAEGNDDKMDRIADALTMCQKTLEECFEDICNIESDEVDEPDEEVLEESLDDAVDLIDKLDASSDPEMKKVASVFDELLLTVCSDKKKLQMLKEAKEDELNKLRDKCRLERIKELYPKENEQNEKLINAKEVAKKVEEVIEKKVHYRPMQHALSTRYSPDMPGENLVRIGDNVWQCPLTKKIYNYEAGYTTDDGDVVPGTSITNQTDQLSYNAPQQTLFNSRQESLNGKG